MLFVDRLSKMAHLVAMAQPVTANNDAQICYEDVLKSFGVPVNCEG